MSENIMSTDLLLAMFGQIVASMGASSEADFQDTENYTTFNNQIMNDNLKTQRESFLKSNEYKEMINVGNDEEKIDLSTNAVSLTRCAIDLWMKQSREPTLGELIDYLVDNHIVCQCPQRTYGNAIVQDYKKFLHTWIARYGEIPVCSINATAMEYFHYEHKFPTRSVLRQYLINSIRFTGESKLGDTWKPAKSIDKLKKITYSECEKKSKGDSCVLCMEEYSDADKCIQLKCGHIYHSREKDGENNGCGGIQEWLEKNGDCPTCKARVD